MFGWVQPFQQCFQVFCGHGGAAAGANGRAAPEVEEDAGAMAGNSRALIMIYEDAEAIERVGAMTLAGTVPVGFGDFGTVEGGVVILRLRVIHAFKGIGAL